MATTGLRSAVTRCRPTDASTPISPGRSTTPGPMRRSPVRRSSPAGRTLAPSGACCMMRMRSRAWAGRLALDLVGVLKGHDGVRAGRDGRARHDADGRAGLKVAVRQRARLHVADDGQLDRGVLPRAGHVLVTHREAVHCRVVQRRQVQRRRDFLGQRQPQRVGERNLHRRHQRDVGEDLLQRLLHAQHVLLVTAVVVMGVVVLVVAMMVVVLVMFSHCPALLVVPTTAET